MDRIRLSRRILGVSLLVRFLWRFSVVMSVALLALYLWDRPSHLPLFLDSTGLMAVNASVLCSVERILRWGYRQMA